MILEPPVKALIFDMDGLLVDSEGLASIAMNRMLDERCISPRAEVQERLLGRRLVEALAIVKEGYELDDELDFLVDQYAGYRTEALRGSVQPMPGALEIIQRARLAGLPIGLATSGMRIHVDISLGETGLAGGFDSETTGDEVNRGKPSPDLFLLAAERIGLSPSEIVVLEDSPLGVEAAHNAGMRVIGVLGHAGRVALFPVEPTVLVQDLHEAADWLGLPTLGF